MAKDKKKKKQKKKGKSKSSKTQSLPQISKKTQKVKGLSPGVTIGNQVDRSGDNLFLGTDYREIHSWNYDRSWSEILADVELWHPLPFTHGIEMELIIADDAGAYPDGDEMVFRMREIVKEAIKIMDQILYEGRSNFLPVPDYIRQKVLARPWGAEDLEKGFAMKLRYHLPNGSYVDIDSFARDGNVTAITYILEVCFLPVKTM